MKSVVQSNSKKTAHHGFHAPGFVEFASLLNHLPGAVLLLRKDTNSIILANNLLIQMTAYAQDEILGKPFHFLFPGLTPNDLTPGFERNILLNRRMREPIPVRIRIQVLDIPGQWILILVESLQVQKKEDGSLQEELLSELKKLLVLLNNAFSNEVLKTFLVHVKNLLKCDEVSLYQARDDKPELDRVALIGEETTFPSSIPSAELIRLSGTVVWNPGKKVVTEIHRSSRVNDLNAVVSCSLGDEKAMIGLLVAAKKDASFSNEQIALFEYLSMQINQYIEKGISAALIQEELDKQILLGNIWKGVFENAQQGILVLSPENKILFANSILELMMGYVEWEVQGQPVENILIGSDKLQLALVSALQGIASPDIGTAHLHRRDGSSFPAQIQVVPILYQQRVIAIIVFVTDISEHEQIKVHTQQLEHRALLGEFTSVFAHEVRNPINNISTGLQLLSSRLDRIDPNQELISRMLGDCTRLNELMESVLTFSKPLELKLSPLELDVLIKKIIDRWYPRFLRVKITPYMQVAEKLPKVIGDSRALEHVFTNLISNALEAMSSAGGNLSIRIMPFNEVTHVPQVEVTITDNGPGIPDEIKDKIFEPFVTNKARGTGLGLAIVKQIVTAHHGSVQLSTFPGGTTFHVFLPAYTGD